MLKIYKYVGCLMVYVFNCSWVDCDIVDILFKEGIYIKWL